MGGKPTKEIVEETIADIGAQNELIKAINELYDKLKERFDEDSKKINDSVIVFKHENFSFTYTRNDDIAGIVDTACEGLEKLKPAIKNATSLNPDTYSNGKLQAMISGNIGSALDQLTGLFSLIGPHLGQRTGTSYEWSTDMRLMSDNMFLYNAAFVYKFKNDQWFHKTDIVAVGYFSYIFQSNAFSTNFESLKKGLFRLDEFDAKALRLKSLEARVAKYLEEAMEQEGDAADKALANYEKFDIILQRMHKDLLGSSD